MATALRVAGLTIAVEPISPGLRLLPDPWGKRFLGSPHVADLRLRARWRALAAAAPGPLVFDSGGSWRLYDDRGQRVLRLFARQHGEAPYAEARLEAGGLTGELLLDPRVFPAAEPVDALRFPLDEVLFLQLLAARGGAELHACGVVTPGGQGILFAGQSGDGKTTTARLWEARAGATILSDDRVVVRREDDGWWMYGTPWHGEAALACDDRAPLAAILVLGRGERCELQPLPATRAVPLLLARSFLALHDAAAVTATLAELEGMVRATRCWTYPFVPGPEAVEVVLAAVGEGQ